MPGSVDLAQGSLHCGEQEERVAVAIEHTMFAEHEFPLPAELHANYLVTARAAIKAAQGKPDCGAWRPIETAPRDEVVLICGFACRGYYVTDAKLIDGTWLLFDPASDSYSVESDNHSGWMPRPTPPSSVTSTDKTGAA